MSQIIRDNINTPASLKAIGGTATYLAGYRMIISRTLHGYIYLIHAIGTSRYKIGKTRREPSKRFLELNSSQSPYPLRLLSFFETDNIDYQEGRLHHLAKQYRVHGEWFELPGWWLEKLDQWFYNIKRLAPPVKDLLLELVPGKNQHSQVKDFAYIDVYQKAIDLCLSLSEKDRCKLLSHIGNYIDAPTAKAQKRVEAILKFKILSVTYAIALKKSIKIAKNNLNNPVLVSSERATKFLQSQCEKEINKKLLQDPVVEEAVGEV
jgi:hypothetical protein